jgi:hypothetical protein
MLACAPGRAVAAPATPSTLSKLVVPPTAPDGSALPLWSWQRSVFTFAAGEAWAGAKATDHPTPYGRISAGYQWSAPVQTCFNLRRELATGASTWRPEIEVKLIFAP